MGPGVPYVIGAKLAHPDRPAIAFVGDGAMQMNGMAELITIASTGSSGPTRGLIVAVLHNNDLNQVTWEMRAMEGSPKFASPRPCPTSTTRASPQPRPARRTTSTTPSELGAAWDEALRPTARPCWTSAATRTSRPSRRTPPSSRSSRSAEAVLGGDEDAGGFIKQGIKQKMQQYLPGEKDERR